MPITFAQQLSAAAHRSLSHANPLSAEQMQTLIQLVAARAPRRVLDIGCGPGSFAIGLAEAADVEVIAIDINDDFLVRARVASSSRRLAGRIRFENMDVSELEAESADAVVCIGASQAFGTPAEAVARSSRLLRRGGVLVFADIVWSGPPSDEFLAFLGTGEDYYWPESRQELPFAAAGLKLQKTIRASKESWQAYETGVLNGRLVFAESLDDGQADRVRQLATTWFKTYEDRGRHCLGFSAYVAERP